ncbi:MAG: cysteine desulfurase family protein [Candidatus Pacebacteria bacterium]|nr:cysteine desulfurase family protein [Candidatus Paceibacterota bacterium]
MKKVYLDYAATTPLDSEIKKAMLPYMDKEFGNASSLHSFGRMAKEAIEKARQQVAVFLNCRPDEIIFCGSATEADNLAILGAVKIAQKKGLKPHIITTAIEHSAVLEPFGQLEKEGVEVSYLSVGPEGIVRVGDIEKVLKPNTVLVSVMYANNEIGTIQPIAEIGTLLKKQSQKIIFHTDAVQAANYLGCDVQKLQVDLLTLSGHKIYGPKGAGVLFIRKGIAIEPMIYGGHQENGYRSGTENVAGVVGLGEAVGQIQKTKNEIQNIKRLRDELISNILQNISKTSLNGSREQRLPNNANISFAGAEGESILMALDQEGIAVSTGSACASGSLEPSHVLMALGLSPEKAHGSVRFTLGKYTTEQEIAYVLKVLPKVIERLRGISPVK